MTGQRLSAAYCPDGAIALHELEVEPDAGYSVRCRARLALRGRTEYREASAHGAISAMSEILYGLNAGVEIVSLHHQHDGAGTAAYLLCERDGRQCWAYGRGTDGDEATIAALVAGANQLATPILD